MSKSEKHRKKWSERAKSKAKGANDGRRKSWSKGEEKLKDDKFVRNSRRWVEKSVQMKEKPGHGMKTVQRKLAALLYSQFSMWS